MNGFIFDNWPTEYRHLKKEVVTNKFEDIIYFCVKGGMTYKDINNILEKTFLRVMDQRFPEMNFVEKAKLSGIEQRKYRSLRYKHKLCITKT